MCAQKVWTLHNSLWRMQTSLKRSPTNRRSWPQLQASKYLPIKYFVHGIHTLTPITKMKITDNMMKITIINPSSVCCVVIRWVVVIPGMKLVVALVAVLQNNKHVDNVVLRYNRCVGSDETCCSFSPKLRQCHRENTACQRVSRRKMKLFLLYTDFWRAETRCNQNANRKTEENSRPTCLSIH